MLSCGAQPPQRSKAAMAGGKRRTGTAAAAAAAAALSSPGGGGGAASGAGGGRRTASRRRRAEPNRYADDRPDSDRHATAGSSAAAGSAGSAADLRHQSSAGADNAAAGGENPTAEQPETPPDGAISHRVSVLPALRYVRPGYLQSAVDTLKQQQRAKDEQSRQDGVPVSAEDMDVDGPENGGGKMQMDSQGVASAQQQLADGGSKRSSRTPSRQSSAASALAVGDDSAKPSAASRYYPPTDPRSPNYVDPHRRQHILAQLRSDPALTPLFGPSLGLLHKARRVFKEGSGGGIDDVGMASDGSGTTLRPDWDGVRYNEFYYPQDYVAEEEPEPELDNAGSATGDTAQANAAGENVTGNDSASAAAEPNPRKRQRLAADVLPVSRAVTVLAMTKDDSVSGSGNVNTKDGSTAKMSYRYMAVGDTAGFVTLYATEPVMSQVGRLATTASVRDYESELAIRSRPQKLKRIAAASVATTTATRTSGSRHASDDEQAVAQRSGGTRFAGYRTVIDSTRPLVAQMPNAVEAVAFNCTGTRLAVASKYEVELFDCLTGTMLWSCPTVRLFGVNSTAAVSVSDKGRLVLAEGALKMARRAPLKLSFHPTREDGDIIAGYEFDAWTKKDQQDEDAAGVSLEDREMGLVSPILQFATGSQRDVGGKVISANVKVRGIIPSEDAGSPLALGSRAIAIHDESNPNRLLVVVINNHPRADDVEKDLAWRKKMTGSKMDQSFPHLQELLLVDASSASFKVLHRTVLPSRPGSKAKIITVEALGQSPGGTYTAAATSCKGGIRLYRTDGLVHLATYGEGIKLHSSTIMWQDVFIIKRGNKKGRAEEREDELLLRSTNSARSKESEDSSSSETDYTDLMLVGVPGAFREPIDLNDRIHIWDLADVGWGGTKAPAMTLIAPPKSNGITSLLYDNRPGSSVGDSSKGGGGGRFVISTQSGDCRQFGSKMVSEWPGRMYTAGYIVLNDNVEYVEDEDELDIVVDNHPIELLSQGSSEMLFGIDSPEKRGQRQAQLVHSIDEDLNKALEASMHDADVDILGVDATSPTERQTTLSTRIVSARPEPYLKIHIDSSHGLVGDSANTQINVSKFDVMSLIPSVQGIIKEHAEKNQGREDAKTDDLETVTKEVFTKGRTVSVTNPSNIKKKRGNRRAGVGNKFEGLLKETVNPRLKAIMIKRESWSNGEGSVLRQMAKETAVSETPGEPICEACLGRPVNHRCGSRLNPVAVERAEEERRQIEEEERRRVAAEKRRENNRKRSEAKRHKLQEEQERAAQVMRQLQEEEEERRERLRLDALARQQAVARHEAAQMQQDALVLIGQGNAAAASAPPFVSEPVPIAPTTATAALASQMQQDVKVLMGQGFVTAAPTASSPSATFQMPSAPTAAVAAEALASVSSAQAAPTTNMLPQSLTSPPPTKLPLAQTTHKSPQEEEQERQNIALQLLGMAPMRSSPPSAPEDLPPAPTTQTLAQPTNIAPSTNPFLATTPGHVPAFQSQAQPQVPVAGGQGNGYFPSTLPHQQQQQQAHPPAQNTVLSALDILAQQSQVYNNSITGNGIGTGTNSNPACLQAQQQPPNTHTPNTASAAALLQMASIASAQQQNEAATSMPSQAASQPLVGISVAPQGERPPPPASSLPLKNRGPMHHDDSGAL